MTSRSPCLPPCTTPLWSFQRQCSTSHQVVTNSWRYFETPLWTCSAYTTSIKIILNFNHLWGNKQKSLILEVHRRWDFLNFSKVSKWKCAQMRIAKYLLFEPKQPCDLELIDHNSGNSLTKSMEKSENPVIWQGFSKPRIWLIGKRIDKVWLWGFPPFSLSKAKNSKFIIEPGSISFLF